MKTAYYRLANLMLLSVLLPTISGCGAGGGAGGGIGGFISALFGGSGSGSEGSGLLGFIGGGITGGSGGGTETITTLASVHNPEPATMFLMGSGIAAMAMFKKNARKKQ